MSELEMLENINARLEEENRALREQIYKLDVDNIALRQRIDALTKHNARGAGRRKNDAKMQSQLYDFAILKDAGNTPDVIMRELRISQATYYRYQQYYYQQKAGKGKQDTTKHRQMTPEEQAEYDKLVDGAEQVCLDDLLDNN